MQIHDDKDISGAAAIPQRGEFAKMIFPKKYCFFSDISLI
jgi:hypothetical protein